MVTMGSSHGCQGTMVSWGKVVPEHRQWEGQPGASAGQRQDQSLRIDRASIANMGGGSERNRPLYT